MDLIERQAACAFHFKRHPWEQARLKVIQQILYPQFAKLKGSKSIVLDIGSGDGFVVQSLAACHPEIQFIGVDSAFDASLPEKFNLPDSPPNCNIYSSIDRLSAPADSVGMVLFLDVIEHVKDDVRFLSTILKHRLIQKDAWILLSVPAFQSLFSSHDVILHHYRRYDEENLLQVARSADIQVHRSGYFFFSLLLLRYLSKRIEKTDLAAPPESIGVSGWKQRNSATQLIKNFLCFDFALSQQLQKFNVHLPGLSCFLVGQRSG